MPDALRGRLARAYGTAMQAAHDGGQVEIHFGPAVIAYLKGFATHTSPLMLEPRCWGFSVIEAAAPADHISVHTVQHIL